MEQDLEKILFLAGLELEPAETFYFAPAMKRVLEAFAVLETVDTTRVPPDPIGPGVSSPLRPDIPAPSTPRSKIMNGRGRRNEGFYTVRKVIP